MYDGRYDSCAVYENDSPSDYVVTSSFFSRPLAQPTDNSKRREPPALNVRDGFMPITEAATSYSEDHSQPKKKRHQKQPHFS